MSLKRKKKIKKKTKIKVILFNKGKKNDIKILKNGVLHKVVNNKIIKSPFIT